MKRNLLKYILLLLITFQSCREAFDAETNDFVSAIVVEATITNELKQQKILLSKTYVLEENEPTIENNATVWVEDNVNNSYTFSQDAEGNYISDIAFQAAPNNLYTLYITTQEGKNYQSTTNTLTPISQIDNLYAELITEDNKVAVMVDNFNENDAIYFRYEYEETYKVVVPYHSNNDIIIDDFLEDENGITYNISIEPRDQDEETCYTTIKSTGISQTATNNLENNNVFRFKVREINQDASVLRDRYSILVRQYVQSLEAYTYYKTINELGSLQSILSASQPGYVVGNVTNIADENEKVIGYFEVNSVTDKRIYFNYVDFGLSLPPWFYHCDVQTYNYNAVPEPGSSDPNERRYLYNAVVNLGYNYISHSGFSYTIVNTECGDCTSFSSNIVPDFWED